MQKQTGELKEVGTWWSAPRSVMEGYVEFIKVGDARFRKVGCGSDLHDFLKNQMQEGSQVSVYMHKWLGTTNLILGAKNEKTGDSMMFHFPSLIVMMIKTFFLLAIFALIVIVAGVSILTPRAHPGFTSLLFWACIASGIIIFMQCRAFMQAKAAV